MVIDKFFKISSKKNSAPVAILMCTYNGQEYLARQLRSFLEQNNKNWRLHISDDGSTDNTLRILNKFRSRVGSERVIIYDGPQAGFARNFMSLICNRSIQAEYYALSDQDDIWEPKKLDAALQYLNTVDRDKPALYCGRTTFVDPKNRPISLSVLPERALTFQNALVQNIASGNTMVMNNAARNILMECGADADIYTHDWLIYILVSGFGGNIYYEPTPLVRYRQHDKNLIGMNSGTCNKLIRTFQLIRGEFKNWNEKNLNILDNFKCKMQKDNIKTINIFSQARTRLGFNACLLLRHSGVYRQKSIQTLALYFSAFLGKI
jgi:glycosyltransferase involved in cell wall biosynthesis